MFGRDGLKRLQHTRVDVMDNGSGRDNSDAQLTAPEGQSPTVDANESAGVTRRTFSGSALAGSGVILTLGNTAAWGDIILGKKDKIKVCVSKMLLESFEMGSNFKHKKDKDFIKYMNLLDYNGNPPPGHEIVHDGRLSCIVKRGKP